MKERFPDTTLVLHSNRRLSHDHPEVLRSKADFFVIKPMTLRDLSQFLALRGDLPSEPSSLPPPSFPSLTESDATAISPPPPVKVPLQSHQDAATDPLAHEKGPQTSSQKLIAIVDDDIFIREAWVQKIRPYPTRSFSSVEDLLGELERDTPLSSQFELMILDQYLEDGMTGLEFAQKIRRQETPLPANIPLVLATDAYDSIEKDPKKRSFVDLVLSKDPLTYPDIIKKLESLKKS